MKYKDQNTLKMQSKFESRIVGDSDRARKRKREKELNEFWNKSLKGHLSEDFWNALNIDEKSSVSHEFRHFEGDKKEFVKMIKVMYHEKLQKARELALKKLGI